jgi:hypothetical protein
MSAQRVRIISRTKSNGGKRATATAEGGIYESNPNANRGTLVQVDAYRANVALARSVRMPDMRAAPPGLLGTACRVRPGGRGITAPGSAQ